MGLGKTLQILAFLLSEKEQGKVGDELRTLIVAPASLVYNWKKEVERFTPQLSVCVMAGTAHERKELIKNQTSNVDVWITSYDLLKRDIELYQDIVFANEIIDEAQYCLLYTSLPITCMSMALPTFISQNLGAKEYNRAKKGAVFGIITGVAVAELIGIGFYIRCV